MSPTAQPLRIPSEVRASHTGWDAEVAWSHVPEAATWRLTRDSEARYLKVTLAGWEPSLAAERTRLEWAAGRLVVPRVLDAGR